MDPDEDAPLADVDDVEPGVPSMKTHSLGVYSDEDAPAVAMMR